MTRERMRSVRDLLAEAKRLMGASELHVQFFDVPRDAMSTLLVEGAAVTNDAHGMTAAMDWRDESIVLDAFRGPEVVG